MKQCNKCGKEYFKPYHESKKNWETRKYCSHSCSNSVNASGNTHSRGRIPWNKGKKLPELSGVNNPRWKRVLHSCKECGIEFYAKQSEVNRKFCSNKCKIANQDTGISSENEKARKSVAYAEWRKKVFERDDYTCKKCHTRGGTLHADHIKSFAYHKDLRLDLNNGQTLCVDCHKQSKNYGGKARTVGQEA